MCVPKVLKPANVRSISWENKNKSVIAAQHSTNNTYLYKPDDIKGDIPGIDGSGLAVALRHASSVPIGLSVGFSMLSTKDTLPGARGGPMCDGEGDEEVEGPEVGTGEPDVVWGGDEFTSWGRGVNRAPGVVIYRGWVMGSAVDVEQGGSNSGRSALGRLLGWAMSFHTLGLRVWPTLDRKLLSAAGNAAEVVTVAVVTEIEEVLVGDN